MYVFCPDQGPKVSATIHPMIRERTKRGNLQKTPKFRLQIMPLDLDVRHPRCVVE